MTTTVHGIEGFHKLVGEHIGWSEWLVIDQERINLFADATDDHQWIHVDPERAKQTPFGGTIAHGFLTLSLVAPTSQQLMKVTDAVMGVNYGLDRVRFPAPLPVGGHWRGGMEILEVKAGHAVLTMTIQPHMVNGHGIAHGGFIFTLADSAFAFACNSHNQRTVAAQCNISFIRPGKLGDTLVAAAREISRTGRSGIYDVRVTVNDTVVAELRGHSRTIGGALVPMAEAAGPK